MEYSDAIKLKNSKQSLIGLVDDYGFVVDDIIIVPTSDPSKNAFFKIYRVDFDAEQSILPFKEEDVEVWAVNTKYVNDSNILFYNILTDESD